MPKPWPVKIVIKDGLVYLKQANGSDHDDVIQMTTKEAEKLVEELAVILYIISPDDVATQSG